LPFGQFATFIVARQGITEGLGGDHL